jgi:hypothetical protein
MEFYLGRIIQTTVVKKNKIVLVDFQYYISQRKIWDKIGIFLHSLFLHKDM